MTRSSPAVLRRQIHNRWFLNLTAGLRFSMAQHLSGGDHPHEQGADGDGSDHRLAAVRAVAASHTSTTGPLPLAAGCKLHAHVRPF
jgi:hypothetical protein